MTPRPLAAELVRDAPVLRRTDTVEHAVRTAVDAGLPALPVADDRDRFIGSFGELEFLGAVFPGYFKELSHAGFVPRSLDAALEKRAACRGEPVAMHMSTEWIAVPTDFSDAQVAETLLHHPTLVVPVVDDERRVRGVITREAFVGRVAGRLFDLG